METLRTSNGHVKLPIVGGGDLDIEAELAKFEREERAKLGLVDGKEHWRDLVPSEFFAKDRAETTILVSGLTMAQDYFVVGALSGIGYKLKHLDCPDNDALRYGKEFGNRGQCNPTYFTVGNLIKYLTYLKDDKGQSVEEIVKNNVFLTAGACGPCRFGMYATEYRKALRDAGFDGFRVLLFQQTGGLDQATGEAAGLELNPKFFIALVKALVAGDVLNAVGYRIRPYEVEAGATNVALEECKKLIWQALHERTNILLAMHRAKQILARVKVDRTQPKPRVSIIGEFWAMTTEGDGNYELQKFLEGEGAECEIQLVSAWLLYNIWEATWDTKRRMEDMRGVDKGRKGLAGVDTRKKLIALKVADQAVRGAFQAFANAVGLYDYHLPDMFEVAEVAARHYDNHLRGGEGHMEVGKLILNVEKNKVHMTLSVKPFGCMPSSGVSDGVQTIITEKYPQAIFCPIETSGDGKVNVYSRVQMYLFKARKVAREEFEKALAQHGITAEELRAFVAKSRFGHSLHRAPHAAAGTSADLVHEVAPRMKSRWKRAFDRATAQVPSLIPA